jgi:hypothetical protein
MKGEPRLIPKGEYADSLHTTEVIYLLGELLLIGMALGDKEENGPNQNITIN